MLVSEVMLQQTQVERVVRGSGVVAALADGRIACCRAPRETSSVPGRAWDTTAAPSTCTVPRRTWPPGGWPDDLTELPGVGRYTADAVARAAFGADVLPVDTNIRRVLERTGGSFGADSTDALMDLGATVCIARIPRCEECPLSAAVLHVAGATSPSRKQGRYEGSFRQRRAETLRLVAERPRSLAALDGEVVAALARDGLVELRGRRVRLPVG